MIDQSSILSCSLSTNRKRKRKNKRPHAIRSSSIFTSTSFNSSAHNDELETAKAAAIKLLDLSSDLINSCLINEITSDQKKNKRTRFDENQLESIASNNILDCVAQVSHSKKELNNSLTLQEPQPLTTLDSNTHSNSKYSSSSNSRSTVDLSQSTVQMSQPSSSTPQNLKREPGFHVTREEVFSDNAIVDAFHAAMNEFNFFRREQRNLGGISVKAGSDVESIKIPKSSVDQRRTSALYYGQPPSCSVSKNKKPKSDSIFLPRLTVPSNVTNKEIEAKEEKQDLIKPTSQSNSKAASQCSQSDLDMADYWDMMDTQSESECVDKDNNDNNDNSNNDDNYSNNDNNGDDDDYYYNDDGTDDTDEGDVGEEDVGEQNKENRKLEEKKGKNTIEADQSILKATPSNKLQSESTKEKITNNNDSAETICSSSTTVTRLEINESKTPGSNENNVMNLNILTDSQKILLSNALNAQYWAGYHTAIFNQSIGLNLQNLPLLVPQSSANNTSSQNLPLLAPQSSDNLSHPLPNLSSLSTTNCQSTPPH